MARNVLVTGSSTGIGAATAVAFAKRGDNVGITYNKNPEAAQVIAEKCRKYGVRAEIFGGDISKREVVEQMMHDFFEKFGTIDVLVNNAGGALKMPEGGFEKMPLEYWESQINLNLNAPAYFSHFAMKNMIEHGTKGSIVNISSVHSQVTWVRRKTLPYTASKAGLNMFTKNLTTAFMSTASLPASSPPRRPTATTSPTSRRASCAKSPQVSSAAWTTSCR